MTASPGQRIAAGAAEREVEVAGLRIRVLETDDVDRDLEEAIERGTLPPYGRVLWPSAITCVEAVSKRPLQGLRVVEIGAGCGLVSLACAALGANVVATDVDAGALAFIAEAAARQGLTLTTARFDVFGDEPLPACALLLCADVLYEEHLARAVARRVLEAHGQGTDVVLVDPGRTSRAVFAAELARAGVPSQFDGEPLGVFRLQARA